MDYLPFYRKYGMITENLFFKENKMLPKDPIILLSYVNTRLRDYFTNLEEFCRAEEVSPDILCEILAKIDYHYDEGTNQFL